MRRFLIICLAAVFTLPAADANTIFWKKKKEVPCWGIEEGKPADINLSKGHYRKILKCGILACKDNYRGIIYDSEKKEY